MIFFKEIFQIKEKEVEIGKDEDKEEYEYEYEETNTIRAYNLRRCPPPFDSYLSEPRLQTKRLEN